MRRVGHQVHGGAHDAGAVAGEHDRAVHLAQLTQAGRGELDVEREAAGADRLDDLVVAEDDQGAGAAAQDALQPVAQRGAGSHQREVGAQRVAAHPAAGESGRASAVIGRAAEPLAPARSTGLAAAGLGASRSSGTCTFYGLSARARGRGSATASQRDGYARCVIVLRGGGVGRDGCSLGRHPGRPLQRRADIAHLDDPACSPECRPTRRSSQPGGTSATLKPSRAASASRRPHRTDPADLAGQPDLADRHQVRGHARG